MAERRDHQFDAPALIRPQQRKRNVWPIVAGVAVVLTAVVAILSRTLVSEVDVANSEQKQAPSPPAVVDKATESAAAKSTATAKSAADDNLIADDGKAMWTSPTAGKPLGWNYLPPGVQMVVALRPAAILNHPEGDKIVAALGPLGGEAMRSIEGTSGIPLRQMDQLVTGWQLVGDRGELAATLVVYRQGDEVEDTNAGAPADAKQLEHAGHKYWLAGDRAYFKPGKVGGPAVVVAPVSAIEDVIDLGGEAPPLRRDMARLLAQTDVDRHVTIVVAPGVLFGEGREMFAGELARLRPPLFWFLGDDLSAAALSLHWGDDFFLEAVATSTLDVIPGKAAQQLLDRVSQMPDRIEAYAVELEASSYSRRVIARLPGMVRKLATYTRSGYGRDAVVLRAYLPAIAGHNLLTGAELVLAEPPSGGRAMANPPADFGKLGPGEAGSPTTTSSAPVSALLQRLASLKIPRDTLEAALNQLSRDIGVEIIIRGPDLQLEGITKNQSFGIDLENRPAGEILVEILRKANPDKSAASPQDPKQKLVYVIGPKTAGGPEAIFVTTRSKAAERGESLPVAFQTAN